MEVYKYVKKYYYYALYLFIIVISFSRQYDTSADSSGYSWETFFFICMVMIVTVLISTFFDAIKST